MFWRASVNLAETDSIRNPGAIGFFFRKNSRRPALRIGISMDEKMQAAVEHLYDLPRFTKKNSLAHTRRLLERLGNPCADRSVIHVAGSNGKGSVCCFLYHMLLSGGASVGLFTSPHLVDIRERFQINGNLVTVTEFLKAYERVQEAAAELTAAGEPCPTFFEQVYAVGMLLFQEAGVDWIVLETGLGGRLDATNSFPTPALCVITSLALEHTEILGDTIEEIAAEKAGILRPGVPVVFSAGQEEYGQTAGCSAGTAEKSVAARQKGSGAAARVIRERARELGAPAVMVAPLADKPGAPAVAVAPPAVMVASLADEPVRPAAAMEPPAGEPGALANAEGLSALNLTAQRRAKTIDPLFPVSSEIFYEISKIRGNTIDFSLISDYDKTTVWHVPGNALYQAENAALAVTAMRTLRRMDHLPGEAENELRDGTQSAFRFPEPDARRGALRSDDATLQRGLSDSDWPGRMQEVQPDVWLDGAHNPAGIAAFLASVRELAREDAVRPLLLVSMLREKDLASSVALLKEGVDWERIVVTGIPEERCSDPLQLAALFAEDSKERVSADKQDGKKEKPFSGESTGQDVAGASKRTAAVEVIDDCRTAFFSLCQSRKRGQKLFCTGSLYLVGDLLEAVWQDREAGTG